MKDAPAPPSTLEEAVAELKAALRNALRECYAHNDSYHHHTPDDDMKYWSWLVGAEYYPIFRDDREGTLVYNRDWERNL